MPTKILKVDLPSRRVITVVAHKGRTLKDVLRPLLNKYGFNVDMVSVWCESHRVCMDTQAIETPTRLILTSAKDEGNQSWRDNAIYRGRDMKQNCCCIATLKGGELFLYYRFAKGGQLCSTYVRRVKCSTDSR